ncbi:MAG: hypothetical protein BWX99_02921 [Deltaproteobacteria bacterium ADurb.Bin151]|nr:MAG: hypothetical protein BWX99_02921 [Deltaproteobacteria bacterium ADurb.Bin151]
MDEDDVRFRVIDGIFDLVRRQAPVDCEQHGSHHGNGKETFQIAVGVIVEDSDCVSLSDANSRKCASQPVDPIKQILVSIANPAPVNNFLVLCAKPWSVKQFFNGQLKPVTTSIQRFPLHIALLWLQFSLESMIV